MQRIRRKASRTLREAFLFALQVPAADECVSSAILECDGWNKAQGSFVPNDEQDAGLQVFSFRRWHGNSET